MISINTHRNTKATNLVTASSFFAILLAVMLPIQISSAQSVEPMVFELEPIGSRSSQSLRIENSGSSPLTVEITALNLIIDQDGNETNSPADNDFLIYPPQTIIHADSTQIVKVKYIGDPSIDTSKAYRIAVSQLPVDLKTGEGSNVSILTKFLTVANVSPRKSKPQLAVTDIQAREDNQWVMTVENSGNRFGLLSESTWELENLNDPAANKKFNNSEVNAIIPRSLVLPNSTLRFSIPAIEGFDAATTKINLKLKKIS